MGLMKSRMFQRSRDVIHKRMKKENRKREIYVHILRHNKLKSKINRKCIKKII